MERELEQTAWVQSLALPLIVDAAVFPQLQNGDLSKTSVIELLGANELMDVKC